jgi:hypothetical protein
MNGAQLRMTRDAAGAFGNGDWATCPTRPFGNDDWATRRGRAFGTMRLGSRERLRSNRTGHRSGEGINSRQECAWNMFSRVRYPPAHRKKRDERA